MQPKGELLLFSAHFSFLKTPVNASLTQTEIGHCLVDFLRWPTLTTVSRFDGLSQVVPNHGESPTPEGYENENSTQYSDRISCRHCRSGRRNHLQHNGGRAPRRPRQGHPPHGARDYSRGL